MWTKGELIQDAFLELGRAEYAFAISPEEYQSALRRLDSLMASWEAAGIRLGYAMPSDQNHSDISQDSGLPDSANLTVSAGLAISLAPSYGIELSPATVSTFNKSYSALLAQFNTIPLLRFPERMPVGAGNKGRAVINPFMTNEEEYFAGNDGELNIQ